MICPTCIKPMIRIGRLQLFLWSGSWSWVESFPCGHCRNLYIGPFGVEWLTGVE